MQINKQTIKTLKNKHKLIIGKSKIGKATAIDFNSVDIFRSYPNRVIHIADLSEIKYLSESSEDKNYEN